MPPVSVVSEGREVCCGRERVRAGEAGIQCVVKVV